MATSGSSSRPSSQARDSPRSLTALVGPSGFGKTTVTRLLTRYADPGSGTVRIGGVDLRTADPAGIYRHISVVFQDGDVAGPDPRPPLARPRLPGGWPTSVTRRAAMRH
ncbi:ATP-binding cassette domain-containing protein [Streptomyces sp. 6N223]|uniref:ATP-binding cassette domain-containing protein n=1 Tax=Streptomyces sp. 6N223 TaxID=3457412 RepID=UPI003FCFDAFC